ncbi:hypothetical protein C8R46DRAFT_1325449 [Mycena filopes]|nr:hypothetical protein C8R46DRAFT_1325449 [Mycena filopes]
MLSGTLDDLIAFFEKSREALSYKPDDRILVFVSGNAHKVGTSMLIPLITAAMSSQLNTPAWETFTFGGSQKTDIRASSTSQIKEPAQCIYPDRPIGPSCCFPNVIIETGLSETHTQLKTDMYRWFAAEASLHHSRGAVKLVILLIIDEVQPNGQRQPSILVELYEEDPDQTGGARRRGNGLILSGDLAGKSLLILWTDLFDAGTVPGYLTAPGQPPGITIDEEMLNAWKSAIFRAVSNSACLPNLGGAYLHSYR